MLMQEHDAAVIHQPQCQDEAARLSLFTKTFFFCFIFSSKPKTAACVYQRSAGFVCLLCSTAAATAAAAAAAATRGFYPSETA